MKKTRILLGSFLLMMLSMPSWSQIKQVDFITGGIQDAKPLFEAYLGPYANSFGADLNAGWYNTAKPHKLGGFDVTLTFNASWAPKIDRDFNLNDIGLSSFAVVDGDPVTPTIAGKATPDRPYLTYMTQYEGNDIELARYQMPNGTGVNMVPVPMAQLGVGLPFGTDVTFRYLPTLKLGDAGNVGLWGIGGKHNISQHIPVLKRLPVLDISVQGGYTRLSTFANVDFPATELVPSDRNLVSDNSVFDDQRIELSASAWTLNLIASQTLPVITFYEGIGYSNSTVNFGLKGNYPFVSLATSGAYAGEIVVTDDDIITDPEELNFEMQNSRDLRLNAGFRIKLGVLTIHFDYTKANYSVVTAGLGVSFR